jgi:hypothetical protein
MRGRAAGGPLPLSGGDVPIEITPENYKFLEERARKQGNISIEECFNNFLELEMMRMELEDAYPWFRERMHKVDEVRRWAAGRK